MPAALLVGVAALSLLGHPRRTHAPPMADWRQGAAHVAKTLAPDELFRVHPSWDESALPFLVGVQERRSPQHQPTIGDLHGASAVVVLTETERLDEALGRLPFDAEVASEESFGEVSVVRVVIPEWARPVESLRELFERERARVKVSPRRGVRVGWREMAEDQRRCIAVDLTGDDPEVTLTFQGVELRRTLRLSAGRDLFSARLHGRAKSARLTSVEVKIAGEDVWSAQIPSLESMWEAVDVDTSTHAGSAQDVIVTLRANVSAGQRLCVDGWVLP